MKKLVFLGSLLLLVCPGCSGDDDSRLCGNQSIDEGETCDPPATCPADCDDDNDCTTDLMTGSAQNCNVDCSHTAITQCQDGDGCCPADCSANNDDDCSSSCGNNEIEDGETCDPPATCPADCDDGDLCTEDLMAGSPGNCNVVCTYPVITQCHNGDGCCPQDCTSANDDDCGGEVDCQFDPAVSWHVIGEILQMESAGGGTCVWLKRKDLCPPGWVCKAHPFNLLEIRIGHDGSVVEQDNPSMLSWSSTHHNWSDVGTATIGSTTYRLEGASSGNAYNITATGGENWGPARLEPWEP